MIGYAYILNGKPVVNPEKKPEIGRAKFHSHPKAGFSLRGSKFKVFYQNTLIQWEKNCIEIENAHFEDEWLIWLQDGHDDYAGWPFNKEQRLEYTLSNGKAVVTKI